MDGNILQEIEGYELLEKVGAGGFGEVYRAQQKIVDREVAIKFILPLHANQDEFINRFEAEAQLVARIEHPYIVPLYDFWRGPNGAYLVMRWLSGGNLADSLLLQGPWDVQKAATLLDNIASALHVAHRKSVIHQDIKPENIMLDEDENGYLTDFGIARDLQSNVNLAAGEDNVVHGSPKYVSPEHLRRTEITAKSDVYSLGLLIYEVLTGEAPFESDELLKLLQMQLKTELPALQSVRPDLPEALNQPLRQATAKNPVARFDTTLEFARAFRSVLEQSASGTSISIPSQMTKLRSEFEIEEELINPYKGLNAFREADADDFYGREGLVQSLIERISDVDAEYARFLAVAGPSGSGKSSIVHAGLTPKIRRGKIENLPSLFVTTMTPGENPMRSLEGALLRVAQRLDDRLMSILSSETFNLHDVVTHAIKDDGEILLIVDQFEEAFTLSKEDTRASFLDTLFDAVTRADSRVRVIVTIRADFLDRPMEYTGWGELFRSRMELVPPMNAEELNDAIEKPAQQAGLALERGLVGVIIGDVREEVGSLPLLQYTLGELFERRTGIELTVAAYNEMGGISGALAKRAEETYEGLNEEQKRASQQLLPRLVKLGEGAEDTRRRALLGELYSLDLGRELAEATLQAYQESRLLTFGSDSKKHTPTVEVAHEALIRKWRRLGNWLDQNRDALRTQELLASEAAQWTTANKSTDFLARGARLEQFSELRESGKVALASEETEYLNASIAYETRRRQIRQLVAVSLVAISLIAAISALIATNQRLAAQSALKEVERQKGIAEEESYIARSGELAASALLFTQQEPDRAALLSLHAVETRPTFSAINSLLTSLQSQEHLRGYYNAHSDAVRAIALSSDSRILASGARDGEIILWDVETRNPLSQIAEHQERINGIALSTDGTLFAAIDAENRIILWDVTQNNLIHALTEADSSSVGWDLAFALDDTILVSSNSLGQMSYWDVQTGELLERIKAHDDAIYTLATSPDGKMIASGSGDSLVRLWDAESHEELATLEGHTDWVRELAFSPDGRWLASGGHDTTVIVWQVEQQSLALELPSHRGWVYALIFSADSRTLVSGDDAGTIIFWPLFGGERPTSIQNAEGAPVWDIVLTDESILVGSETNSIFDLSPARLPSMPFDHVVGESPEVISSVAILDDDRETVVGAGGTQDDFFIHVWDVDGVDENILPAHQGTVNGIAQDNGRIATVSVDGQAIIWEDLLPADPLIFDTALFSVALQGDYLVVGDVNGTIQVWSLSGARENWEQLYELKGHTQRVFSIAINTDGTMLASAGLDGTIRLWDLETGTALFDPLLAHTDGVLTVSFSPDGSILASGGRDQRIYLWDTVTGEVIGEPLLGHTNWVNDLVFGAEGLYLYSAGGDHSIRIWDTEQRRQLGLPLSAHSDWVTSLAISADGRHMVSGGRDGEVLLWNLALEDWALAACAFSNRDLSEQEIEQYFSERFPPFELCKEDASG